MQILKNLLGVLLGTGSLTFVLINVAPPASFTSATTTQLAYFFLPVLITTTSLFNFYFNFWPKSFVLGIGVLLLLTFKALEMLNVVSLVLTVAATFLIAKSLRKPKNMAQKQVQIPKLTRLMKK